MRRSRLFIIVMILLLLIYNQLIIVYVGIEYMLYYSLIPTITIFIIAFMIYRWMKTTEGTELEENLLSPEVEKAVERLRNEIRELRRHGVTEELIRMELILADNLMKMGHYYDAREILDMVSKDIESLRGSVNRDLLIQYRRLNRKITRHLHRTP